MQDQLLETNENKIAVANTMLLANAWLIERRGLRGINPVLNHPRLLPPTTSELVSTGRMKRIIASLRVVADVSWRVNKIS